ncbi:MAG: hypothetical protein R6V67_01225 [Spirochaetia bacterium]
MKRRSVYPSFPPIILPTGVSESVFLTLLVRAAGTVFLAAVFLSAFGCAFVRPGVALRVTLPIGGSPWERESFPVLWEVRYPAVGGEVETLIIPPGEEGADIVAARGVNVPVAAYPLGRLKPAGGFAAHTVEGVERLTGKRKLELSWKDGAAAELILESLESPDRIDRVDGAYLSSLLTLEGEGNPWSCDLERVRSSMLFRSLWKTHISRDEVYEVECTLPAGEWIPELPLFEGTVSSAGEDGSEGEYGAAGESEYTVTFTGLYPGMHRFFSPSAGSKEGLELHVMVEKNGEHRFICGPPRIFER